MDQDYMMVRMILSYIVPGVVMVFIGTPLAIAIARRIGRGGAPRGEIGEIHEINERLTRIEGAVDAIAIEVERISEAQRFSVRLQAGDATGAPLLGRAESK
jgi:hypothetical protein